MADAQIGRLIVALEANTSSIEDGAQRAEKRMDSFKGAVDAAKGALAALGAFEVFKDVIEGTAAAEKAQALLASQIKATGDASGYSLGQLEDLANGFSKTTTQSREEVERLESQLLAFRNVGGEQFKAVINAALDFASVTGRDATEAVRLLGQALDDPAQGMQKLARAGVVLDEATKFTVKSLTEQGHLLDAQDILLQQVEKSYGGAASAMRDTLGGAFKSLKNDLTDLTQGHGAGVQELTDSVKALDDEVKDPAVQQGLANLVSGILRLAAVAGAAAAAIARIPSNLGEALAEAQGYAGNFDDQVHHYQTLIKQTQDQIDGLKSGGTPEDSPAIKQLQRQLAEYKYQLQDVQLYQQSLAGGAPGGRTEVQAATAPTHDFQLIDPNAVTNADKLKHTIMEIGGGLDHLTTTQSQIVAIWKQNDPAKALQEQIDATNNLVGVWVDGVQFTADDAQKHIKQLQLDYEQHTDQMTEFAVEAAHNIQDAFAQFLFDPFQEGLDGMLKSFIRFIEQMLAQAAAASILNGAFSSYATNGQNNGFANAFGSLFGGHRAGGGPTAAGMLYQVNEAGPNTEGFVPFGGGSVIPLGPGDAGNSGGRGGDIHVTATLHAQGADGAGAAQILSALPAFQRSIFGAVEHRLSRGVWPS